MTEKIITNTRVGLKIDNLSNWQNEINQFILKKGEPAFAIMEDNSTIMVKIGDGTHTFNQLDWSFYAKASDVYDWAKEANLNIGPADDSNGNVISGIQWNQEANGGKGGITYTKISAATSTELTDSFNTLMEKITGDSEKGPQAELLTVDEFKAQPSSRGNGWDEQLTKRAKIYIKIKMNKGTKITFTGDDSVYRWAVIETTNQERPSAGTYVDSGWNTGWTGSQSEYITHIYEAAYPIIIFSRKNNANLADDEISDLHSMFTVEGYKTSDYAFPINVRYSRTPAYVHKDTMIAINHRGWHEAPENTLSAYKESYNQGFKYVECDVQFTKDGIPVLLHDNTIDRTSNGTGNITELTYAEALQYDYSEDIAAYAGEKIPTFEEFIALCKDLGLHPYIEIKGTITDDQTQELLTIVNKYNMLTNVTWISFGLEGLQKIGSFNATARLGWVVDTPTTDTTKGSYYGNIEKIYTGYNEIFLDVYYPKVSQETIDYCINKGFGLEVYTLDGEEDLFNLHPYISGVTTNSLKVNEVLLANEKVFVPADNLLDGEGIGAIQTAPDMDASATTGGPIYRNENGDLVFDFNHNFNNIAKNQYKIKYGEEMPETFPYGAEGRHAQVLNGKGYAKGRRSHVDGTTSLALGDYSYAGGNTTVAMGGTSHATGMATVAAGAGSFTEGHKTIAQGDYSHAQGNGSEAIGKTSFAGGVKSVAEGEMAVAFGEQSFALGKGAVATGSSVAQGEFSFAEGSHKKHWTGGDINEETGERNPIVFDWTMTPTFNEGDHNYLTGISLKSTGAVSMQSHAEGYQTLAATSRSHAEGYQTVAGYDGGDNAHAEGYQTYAKGENSHAEGNQTFAEGENSHAEGTQTIANGNNSHAEGIQTQAQGRSSHAEGQDTIATGDYSHAEGYYTVASGSCSHTEGEGTTASGYCSHASGCYTTASEPYQTVIGGHNKINADAVFIVGNSFDGPMGDGSNAFEVLKDGRAKVFGTPTEDNDIATMAVVNTKITDTLVDYATTVDLNNKMSASIEKIKITLSASAKWISVCYGNDKFVAVAEDSDKIVYSTDGVYWIEGSLPLSARWQSVCYGDGKFVAIADGTDKMVYSTNGINWIENTLPISTQGLTSNSICYDYDNGKFIVLTSDYVLYSTDGINWMQNSLPAHAATWGSVSYGNGKFVAASMFVSPSTNIIISSTDGINWTESITLQSSYELGCYGNGKFIYVGYRGAIIYSTDGLYWIPGPSSLPVATDWSSICYENGTFVAITKQGDIGAYSIDGINWEQITLPIQITQSSMTYGNNKFVAIAYNSNKVICSTDGITWTDEYITSINSIQQDSTDITKDVAKLIEPHLSVNLQTLVETVDELKGKKLAVTGDSICYGHGYEGGYAKIIGNKHSMTVQNLGVNTATIADGITNEDGTQVPCISNTIVNMDTDADFAILEGGVNDSVLNVPLGALSDGYDATLDNTTFYSAFENMLKKLITRFAGKKYGYIAVHQMHDNFRVSNDEATSYYWAAKKCCEKWGVPFLDLNTTVPPLGYFQTGTLETIKNTYTLNGDGWHPNELGYEKYYVPKIEAWLKTL